jgi:UDP-2,4-diacetamido-2,4,6-trideoxy-beta-L-altropyranose hydrolase
LSTEIIFRANAYPEIGTGHVMRCLALANACRDADMATRFVGRVEDGVLRGRIKQCDHDFTALTEDQEAEWMNCISHKVDWVVLDGYGFCSQDHRKIRDAGVKLLIIDDMANLDSYEADVILNQNFHANAADYHLAYETKMLMGTQFALLRQEFIGRRPLVRKAGTSRLLVTLGGSDPQGVSLRVTEALAKIHDMRFEVRLIAGSSNPHLDQLKVAAELARTGGHTLEVLHYTNDMPGEMAWADFAVIAGGSTSLEVAYMGLPALVLTLANNQASIACAMHRLGVAESLGWFDTLTAANLADALKCLASDVPRRQAMMAQGQALVDGLGAKRVVGTII